MAFQFVTNTEEVAGCESGGEGHFSWWVGVNLAAKGIFLNEIVALSAGKKICVFKLWHYMFECRRHMFEVWQNLPPMALNLLTGEKI